MKSVEIYGDLCKIEQLEVFNPTALNSISHVVNCRGAFGKGLAKAIREHYPQAHQAYAALCKQHRPEQLLGMLQPVEISPNLFICNMFAQLDYGTEKRQLDYEALYKTLEVQAQMAQHTPHAEFYYPKNLGSGLAGGNWYIVQSMIDGLFKDLDNKVYIVALN